MVKGNGTIICTVTLISGVIYTSYSGFTKPTVIAIAKFSDKPLYCNNCSDSETTLCSLLAAIGKTRLLLVHQALPQTPLYIEKLCPSRHYLTVKSFDPHLCCFFLDASIISASIEPVVETRGMNFHWKLVFIVFRLSSLCAAHLHGFVHQSFACKSMISTISPPKLSLLKLLWNASIDFVHGIPDFRVHLCFLNFQLK